MRYVPLNSLPPEEVAEQIFAAVDARNFWFRPHTSLPHEMSGPAGHRRQELAMLPRATYNVLANNQNPH
jgi:hypothetical protein